MNQLNSGTKCSRTVFEISGPDRYSFLQGIVSNDVNQLEEGLVYAAMLTPQGKYLADFFLVPREKSILVDVNSSRADDLEKRFRLYKLRT